MSLLAFYLHLLEKRGHRIALKATDSASHLKAGRIEVLVANVLVAGGSVVLSAHVPQPLLQPDGVVEGKPRTQHRQETVDFSIKLYGLLLGFRDFGYLLSDLFF